MTQDKYDVVIIGSGVGGLSSAGLLTKAGYKTLTVEALDRLGGRFSTQEIEGFKCPTGAMGIETHAVLEGIWRDVGAKFDVTDVSRGLYLIEGKLYELPHKGQMAALLDILDKLEVNKAKLMGKLAKGVAKEKILGAFRKGATMKPPEAGEPSFRDWIMEQTDNQLVIDTFRALTSALFTGINDYELPVSQWFAFVSKAGQHGYKNFGYAPKGNVVVMEAMAEVIKAKGSEVWTNCSAKRIIIEKGKATGVLIERDGKEVEVSARAVISNIGVRETITITGEENFTPEYLTEARGKLRPVPIVATYIASEKPLVETPGIAMIVGAKRVVDALTPTLNCPELAPPGQHLTVTWGTPATCLDHIDKEKELEENLQDIKDFFPEFNRSGRILRMDPMDISDYFPGARTWAGWDMEQKTPVKNLWNVGDAVKPVGWSGMPACAETAKMVVAELKKKVKPA